MSAAFRPGCIRLVICLVYHAARQRFKPFFRRFRSVGIKTEIIKSVDQPGFQVNNIVYSILFGGFPYADTVWNTFFCRGFAVWRSPRSCSAPHLQPFSPLKPTIRTRCTAALQTFPSSPQSFPTVTRSGFWSTPARTGRASRWRTARPDTATARCSASAARRIPATAHRHVGETLRPVSILSAPDAEAPAVGKLAANVYITLLSAPEDDAYTEVTVNSQTTGYIDSEAVRPVRAITAVVAPRPTLSEEGAETEAEAREKLASLAVYL